MLRVEALARTPLGTSTRNQSSIEKSMLSAGHRPRSLLLTGRPAPALMKCPIVLAWHLVPTASRRLLHSAMQRPQRDVLDP